LVGVQGVVHAGEKNGEGLATAVELAKEQAEEQATYPAKAQAVGTAKVPAKEQDQAEAVEKDHAEKDPAEIAPRRTPQPSLYKI
jgi:hypothetical protein